MDNAESESELDGLFVDYILIENSTKKKRRKEDAGFVRFSKIEKPVVITICWFMNEFV